MASAFAVLGAATLAPGFVTKAQAQQVSAGAQLEEVVVTARRQSERLQRVPDAITAITSSQIVNANIQSLSDLSQVVPSLNFRNGGGYSANFFDLRLRGIGQGQSGWPAVAFVIDNVPAPSGNALTIGSLADAERIEVLRGPQSAVYGANAIAGAINIVTKRPTNQTEGEARLYYGNGDEFHGSGSISGALVPDKIYARFYADMVSDNGRIDSASNGMHLDPTYSQHYETRIIFDPTDRLEADFHASYDRARVGFALQDRVPSIAYLNDYRSDFDPRRDYAGRQSREMVNVSARLKWDADFATLTSVSSFSHGYDSGIGSGCYDDVNSPGVFANANGSVTCISNVVAWGDRALPGQAIENFQSALSQYDTFFQDLRVSSSSDGPLRWLFGADVMVRNALDGSYTFANIRQPVGFATNTISRRADERDDRWWGVYGQVVYTYGSWEFTAAGRYDNQLYENTTYDSAEKLTLVPVLSPSGVPQTTQRMKAFNFQPKGQIAYHLDDDRMVYATVSRGFRAGYFSSGSYGTPEHTTNYEAGVKTQWLQRKLQANVSVFHIDYSNQQVSTNLIVPPYRTPVTVPKTRMNGAEFEAAYLLFDGFTISGTLAYLDARFGATSASAAEGTQSPKSPHWSGSTSVQYMRPLNGAWTLNAHADVAFHSQQYLYLNNTQLVPSNAFVNARIGVETDRYGVYFVGRNLTDTIEDQTNAGVNAVYAARYRNDPRSYGIELRVKL